MSLELTVDEIIETLKRSTLTTVLVEGVDDVMIYRWIEDEIGIFEASFLPCGGRNNLLKIYERRKEFFGKKVIYIADKDLYVYTSIPEEYNEIVWTYGYSIENDLYYGKGIESLLSTKERDIFVKSLNNFVRYYSFELNKFLDGDPNFTLRNHPQRILCDVNHDIKEEFLAEVNFVEPNIDTVKEILKDYDVKIRGKSLFGLLNRILNHNKRRVKHSKDSLLEHCYRTQRNDIFIDLLNRINAKLIA